MWLVAVAWSAVSFDKRSDRLAMVHSLRNYLTSLLTFA